MQNKMRLTPLYLGVLTASLMLATATATAGNYKGDYKGEAAPCPQPLMLKDGFYLGAQLGYDSYRVRVSRSTTFNTVAFTGNPVMNATGFVGGLFGGYGMYYNNLYYLGGEIFVNDSGASQAQTESVTNATGTGTTYTKTGAGTSYGISLLPGLKLNDSTLGYIRLGYNRADIQGTETLTAGGVSTNSGSNWNWEGGFNYGLGIESAIAQNISLRTEFTHTSYGSFSSSLVGASGSSFNPSDNQFMLGLIYHFA